MKKKKLRLLLYDTLDFEEAAQPPDLEERLAEDDTDNKQIPPLDAGVGALGGVAVGSLSDNNVLLLVFDLGEEIGQFLDCKVRFVSIWMAMWKAGGCLKKVV